MAATMAATCENMVKLGNLCEESIAVRTPGREKLLCSQCLSGAAAAASAGCDARRGVVGSCSRVARARAAVAATPGGPEASSPGFPF